MRVRLALFVAVLCLSLASIVWAQDAVKVDPNHYSVVTENDQVRIVKVHYGPHEKSVMHSHPNSVAVFLTDASGKFTFADGKTQDFSMKAGSSQFTPAVAHLPENVSDKAFDLILVELKTKSAKAAKPKKPAM